MNKRIVLKNPRACYSLLHKGIPCVFVASYLFLAFLPDVRFSVPTLIGITGLQVGTMALIHYFGEKNAVCWSPTFILLTAALFRLLFLFNDPQLSDDIYRYLWDGLQSLSGNNPYALSPSANPTPTNDLAVLRAKINHPALVTIYPPAAQIVFEAGAFLGGGVPGFKALLVAFDLATCAIIIRLLSLLRMKPWRAVLYAWHPLPILEIAGSGHMDGIWVLFMYIAMLLLHVRRANQTSDQNTNGLQKPGFRPWRNRRLPYILAGIVYGLSVMTKWFPLVFLPGFLATGRIRNRAAFSSGMCLCCVVLIWFYIPEFRNSLHTLVVYVNQWEFAGFLYYFLKETTGSAFLSRLILSLSFLTAMFIIYRNLYRSRSRNNTEDVCSDLPPILNAFYKISLVWLLLTPTLHPWYALSLVCFFPFVLGPAGLSLSWSVFLAYQVLIPYAILGKWVESTPTTLMIFIAPSLSFVGARLFRSAQRIKNQP